MPYKKNKDKRRQDTNRQLARTPRPKPKIDFPIDHLDYRNVDLLKQFVTDQGRLLPRKYTNLPARYQRQLSRSVKRARQMLLMR